MKLNNGVFIVNNNRKQCPDNVLKNYPNATKVTYEINTQWAHNNILISTKNSKIIRLPATKYCDM